MRRFLWLLTFAVIGALGWWTWKRLTAAPAPTSNGPRSIPEDSAARVMPVTQSSAQEVESSTTQEKSVKKSAQRQPAKKSTKKSAPKKTAKKSAKKAESKKAESKKETEK